MANWYDLKASIAEIIKTNGNQEITGLVLRNVLNSIIMNVGENATFAGEAKPDTNPGNPDGDVFYFAVESGTYVNFGGISVSKLAVLYNVNSTTWRSIELLSKDVFYNVNQRTNTLTTYYTLETAIAAIPEADRMALMLITYRSNEAGDIVNLAIYTRTSLANEFFLDKSNWICWTGDITNIKTEITNIKTETKKGLAFYNVNQRTNTLTTYYTLETAIAAIPEADRMALMLITYRKGSSSNQRNGFAQYTAGSPDAKYFLDKNRWISWDEIIANLESNAVTNDAIDNFKNLNGYDFAQDVSTDTSFLVNDRTNPTTISLTGTHYNDLYAGVKIPCKEGDKFLIWGRGGSVKVRLYTFADTNGNILLVAPGGDIAKEKGEGFAGARLFEAPANSSYLLFNPDTRLEEYGCVRLKSYLAENTFQRKFLFLGDSITDGTTSKYTNEQKTETDHDTKPYHSYAYIVANLKNILYDNKGLGGMGYLCNSTSPTYPYNARTLIDHITTPGDKLYVDLTQVDVVSIALGINDYKSNYELGEVSDDISLGTTVCSNMKYLINKILSVNPLIKIFVITPMNARGYNNSLGNESTNYAVNFANTKGKTLKDFMETIIAVCENYGIQYINQTTQSVVNRFNIVDALPDGVHPTIEIQKMIGRELSRKITYS